MGSTLMPDPILPKARDFIRAHQNPDGGWGYRPGGQSLVEPSALCALVLQAAGRDAATGKALSFLKSCQGGDGAVGLGPQNKSGNWMAYAALLAFHGLGATDEERRLKDWILGFESAPSRYSAADLEAIRAAYRYDASVKGWPWTPGTSAWVEPTALFVLALVHAGVPATESRVASGVRLLIDRKVPSGGWNFGNPYAKSFAMAAATISTALALAALGAAGFPESDPAIADGIRFFAKELAVGVSTASLAWGLLALKSFSRSKSMANGAADRLAKLQRSDGGFRADLFETSLAALVLGDAPIIRPPDGKAR